MESMQELPSASHRELDPLSHTAESVILRVQKACSTSHYVQTAFLRTLNSRASAPTPLIGSHES